MKNETFITNILTLAVAGLLILITGITFYFFRDIFSKNVRFFMPIPPLAVAAYIYVYNMFDHFGGELPANILETAKDLGLSIVLTTSFFSAFAVVMVFLIHFLKKTLN